MSFFVDEGEIPHMAASRAQLLGWRDECTVLKNLLENFAVLKIFSVTSFIHNCFSAL